MRNDLNRNAIQSAETQNKSTGKQDKAAYLVSPSNPRPRAWPEKNQAQHIPQRPVIYCGSRRLCRDDKLTAPFPKDIPAGMHFGKHSCSCGQLQALVRKQLLPDSLQEKPHLSPACIYKTIPSLRRLLPDGALDIAWKLFEEAFKIFIIASSHAEECRVMSREMLWGAPLAVFPPSLPPPPVSVQRHLEPFRGSCLSPDSSRSPSTRGEYSVKHSKTLKWLWLYPLDLPSRCYFQLPSLQVLLSWVPEHLCPVLFHCSAQLLEVLMLI